MNKFNQSVLNTLNGYRAGFDRDDFMFNTQSFEFKKGTRTLIVKCEYNHSFSARGLKFRLLEYKAFKIAKEYFTITQIDEIYNVRMGLKSKSIYNLKLNK